MRQLGRGTVALVLCTVTLLWFASAGFAQPETVVVDIPPQELANGLKTFAAQTNLQVLYESQLASGLTTAGVTGTMSPREAIDRLLEGTNLTYAFTDQRTVTIQKAAGKASESPAGSVGPVESRTGKRKSIKLEEVVVIDAVEKERDYVAEDATTATRTQTPLRDVPQAVEVVTRKLMDDQKVIRLDQAVRNVSGLFQGSTGGNRLEQFYCRGFLCGFFKNYLRNDSPNQVRIFRESANLQRLEVLKGPPSVLYGRSEPGGIVNLMTKQPLSESYYSGETMFGSYNFFRNLVDVSGPLNESKTVLYRFNGAYENSESFRDFVTGQRWFAAPVITWKIGDDTSLTVEGEYLRDNRTFDRGIVAIGTAPAQIPSSRFLGEAFGRNHAEEGRAGYILQHRFDKNWTLFSGFRADLNGDEGVEAFARNLLADNQTLRRRYQRQATHASSYYLRNDLVGKFATGSIDHTLLTGLEIGRENNYFEFGSNNNFPSINIFNPVYGFGQLDAPPTTIMRARLSALGAYLQDQVTLLENLKLLAGVRYDVFRINQNSNGQIMTPEDTAISPRFGLVYQPVRPVSLYANFTQSFLPNTGVNCFVSCFSKNGTLFAPERGTQYEGGIKVDIVPERLNATLAFYRLVKKNVLTPDPTDPIFSIQTGQQRSQGVEFDMTANVMPGWDLIATYAYTDARVTSSNDATISNGNRLFNVPRHASSLWSKYEFQNGSFKGFGVGAGVFAVGERTGDLANSFELPGYVRADAALYYRKPEVFNRTNLIAQLNIRNLFGTEYYEATQGTRTQIYPGAPITIIGSLKLEFY